MGQEIGKHWKDLFKETYLRYVTPFNPELTKHFLSKVRAFFSERDKQMGRLKSLRRTVEKWNPSASRSKILLAVDDAIGDQENSFRSDSDCEPPVEGRKIFRVPRSLAVILLSVLEKEKGSTDTVSDFLVSGGELDKWLDTKGISTRRLVPVVSRSKREWRKPYRLQLWRCVLARKRITKKLTDDDRLYKAMWLRLLEQVTVEEIINELRRYDDDADYIFEGVFKKWKLEAISSAAEPSGLPR